MNSLQQAKHLQGFIEAVKGKLKVEGIALDDYDNAIKCLSQCVAPKACIRVYEEFINY